MSEYQPNVGDRVRVVLEGEVDVVNGHEFRVGSDWIARDVSHFVSVEKLASPPPTWPGSVVKHKGCFLVLSASGQWGCPDHGLATGLHGDANGLEVIFDAGQVTP